ncbi:hypothetical protein niasHT_008718 [Heterodera trifolii]|uniref:Ribosomal protein S2 n=1 Tax=Heterodera trifolii TaxID=157864 RepID=A0ABD2M284_9BILA
MASVPMAFEQKVSDGTTTSIHGTCPDRETLRKGKVSPTILKPYIDPTLCSSDPNAFESEVTVGRMFDARVHLGHKVGTLNDNMKWALTSWHLRLRLGKSLGHYLLKALEFVRSVAFLGGRFLFVSTNKSSMLMVETMADELGQYAHTRHWQPVSFTNTKSVFGGPIRLPDTVILLNTLTSAMEAHPALVDSAKMCIPTSPTTCATQFPGNDDSVEIRQLFHGNVLQKQSKRAERRATLFWMAREREEAAAEKDDGATEALNEQTEGGE